MKGKKSVKPKTKLENNKKMRAIAELWGVSDGKEGKRKS